jgi:hypothetical protein
MASLPGMRELTTAQVTARRLGRSHLLEPAPRTRLVDVVRDVALIQAQVLSAAEIGIGIRVRGITAEDIRRELYERHTLIKTWSIRGTLHLVPADEAPLWAAAVRGPDRYWESRAWLASHGLTPKSGAALFDAIADALDGRCLTRAELADAVAERLGQRHEKLLSGWGELLHVPALMGTLCFGPPRGANVTFVRADQWIGGWADVDPTVARQQVLRRYLAAYGPAKIGDFQRWCGFGREAARALFADLADELEEVRVGRSTAWMLGGDDRGFNRDATSVHLLPQYDAFIIGFRPRDPLVPEPMKERIRQDPKGKFESVTGMAPLLIDGVVTGLWRRIKSRSGMRIDVEHVLPLPRGRSRELKTAVARVHEILGQGP